MFVRGYVDSESLPENMLWDLWGILGKFPFVEWEGRHVLVFTRCGVAGRGKG
jgi:hypothetical protein